MSGSGGSFGFQPRYRILDQRLTLDPEIERMMRDIEARMAARAMIQDFLRPDFSLLLPQWSLLLGLGAGGGLPPAPPPAPGPTYKAGAGPATPRPGELSDVASALYKLPAVQRMVEQAHDEGIRQLRVLRAEWTSAGPGGKIGMVTISGVVVGGMVTAALANQPTRDLAFRMIKDKDIPVPKVDGLSFKIMDRGAGVTAPLGVPGLSGSAYYKAPAGQAAEYGATVNFDVMEFVRKRK